MAYPYGATNAVSFGPFSASSLQQPSSIAIGASAGRKNLGGNAIAIGTLAGELNQHQSTIVINATGVALNTDADNATYMAPLRFVTASNVMAYNPTSKEVSHTDTLSTLTISSLSTRVLNYSSIVGSSMNTSVITANLLYCNTISTVGGIVVGGGGGGGGGGSSSGPVAIIANTPSATQSILADTNTLILWDAADAAQSVGITGLSYLNGLFTNTTGSALPFQVDYSLELSVTGGGASYIGINGPSTPYGRLLNESNIFTNTYTVLVPAGGTVGIYYRDTNATVVQTGSRVALTLLTATQGQVATMAVSPTTTQALAASPSLSLVLWGTTDNAQSYGSTGLNYVNGLFINITAAVLPVLVQYTLNLDSTMGGYSAIGINGSTTVYGGTYNDTNGFTNSYTVMVPAYGTLGIYYMDNGAVTVQTTSTLRLTILMAGATGASPWTVSGTTASYTVGNVGIGTTAPVTTLDVAGTLRTSGIPTLGNTIMPAVTSGTTYGSTALVGQFGSGTSSYWGSLACNVIYTNNTGGWTQYTPRLQRMVDGSCFSYIDFMPYVGNGFDYNGLAFGTGNTATGSEWLRITGAGNVGIGTTNPTALLHLRPTSAAALRITSQLTNASTRPALSATPGTYEIRGSSANGEGYDDGFLRLSAGGGFDTITQVSIDLSGYSTQADMDKNIRFTTANTERMRITATGNVGIGTASPSYPLQLGLGLTTDLGGAMNTRFTDTGVTASQIGNGGVNSATITGTGPYTFTNTATNGWANVIPTNNTVGSTIKISITARSSSSNVSLLFSTNGISYQTPILTTSDTVYTFTAIITGTYFSISLIGASGTSYIYSAFSIQRMDVVATGNVGIGTASPLDTLDVNGTLRVLNRSAGPGQNTTGNTLYPGIINLGGSYGPQIRSSYPNMAYTDNISLQFVTNGTSNTNDPQVRMHISAITGNVGIRTTTPQYTLQVMQTDNTNTSYISSTVPTTTIASFLRNIAYGTTDRADIEIGSNNTGSGDTVKVYKYTLGTSQTNPYGASFEIRSCTVGTTYSGPDTRAARFTILNTGEIQFNTYSTNGTIGTDSTGKIIAGTSDRRLKENIVYQEDTAAALDAVNQLKPATFNFIGSIDKRLGFIAQDMETYIPLAVDGKKHEYQWERNEDGTPKFDADGNMIYQLDGDGNKIIRPRGISDMAIIATQTLAIQELAKRADAFALQNQQLSKENTVLKEQLAATSSQLAALVAWAQAQGFSG